MDKYAQLFIVILFLAYIGYSSYDRKQLKKQIDDLELLQVINYEIKADSIKRMALNNESEILELQKILDSSVAKSKTINAKYEKVKNNLRGIDNVDTISKLLTERYQNR